MFPSNDYSRPESICASQNLKIFVGGIPRTVPKEKIVAFFGKFGPIKDVQTFNFKTAESMFQKANNKKGYGVVETYDFATYRAIMDKEDLRFEARKLFKNEFKNGQELNKLNSDQNNKRLIIKDVPLGIKESYLREFLERIAGPIEIIYQFKLDEYNLNSQHKKSSSYSVLFERSDFVRSIVFQRTLLMDNGVEITLERFKYKKKRRINESCLKTAGSLSNKSHKMLLNYLNFELPLQNKRTELFGKGSSQDTTSIQDLGIKKPFDRSNISTQITQSTLSWGYKALFSKQESSSDEKSEEFEELEHSIKPSSKLYKPRLLVHKIDLKTAKYAVGNLKFNLNPSGNTYKEINHQNDD